MPAVHAEIDYKSPLRLDDVVDASLWVDRTSERSVTFRSEFTHPDERNPAVIVRVTQVQVEVIDDTVRAIPLPPGLTAQLARSSGTYVIHGPDSDQRR
jgi:acyl-CoA thioesterase FadM